MQIECIEIASSVSVVLIVFSILMLFSLIFLSFFNLRECIDNRSLVGLSQSKKFLFSLSLIGFIFGWFLYFSTGSYVLKKASLMLLNFDQVVVFIEDKKIGKEMRKIISHGFLNMISIKRSGSQQVERYKIVMTSKDKNSQMHFLLYSDSDIKDLFWIYYDGFGVRGALGYTKIIGITPCLGVDDCKVLNEIN